MQSRIGMLSDARKARQNRQCLASRRPATIRLFLLAAHLKCLPVVAFRRSARPLISRERIDNGGETASARFIGRKVLQEVGVTIITLSGDDERQRVEAGRLRDNGEAL